MTPRQLKGMTMAETPTRYRKKPVEIEAMKWDGTQRHADVITAWIKDNDGEAVYEEIAVSASAFNRSWDLRIAIRTLEGWIYASPEDVIIRGIQGEFYPCKPDIFEATYDKEGES
jgi:hypothetical protein